MYTATVEITIEQFYTIGTQNIEAVIHPPKDISPGPGPHPTVVSGDGESITVTVPQGYKGSVALIYQLPDSRYVLLGAAFKNPNGGVGREEFRHINIHRDVAGSTMTVIDECMAECNNIDYSYVILVQDVASAAIGVIDPDIETEDGEN